MHRLGLILVLTAGQLLGWGGEGHSLVARLAAARLTPAAAARVAEILGPNVSLASIASWADEVRRSRAATAPWHYIDIPIDKPHLDMKRDCPNNNCVLAKIEEFQHTIADPNVTAEQRQEALKFLVHFIGDIHQPLHCSDNKDTGGNDVKLEFGGRPTNLHSLWDSAMIGKLGTEDALFAELNADLGKHEKKMRKGDDRDWAEQSHKLGQKIVYGKLPKTAPIKVDASYEAIADPVIKEQLERAGARLAKVLNQAFK
jgi:hypothetical protein